MNQQKIALVTGGTGGIGTAICIALADQGRKVIAGYFPPEQEIAEAWQSKHRDNGYEFEMVACDVSDYEESEKMLRDVESTISAVDILVNCAGITRDKTLRRMTPEQWDSVLRTNLDSAFNVTRQVVEGMSESGFGRIVNISSVSGIIGNRGQANYAAAKAGLHGAARSLAIEVASRGITVNTIAPGIIRTPIHARNGIEDTDSLAGLHLLDRIGEPEEIANAALLLATSDFITGTILNVDGGHVAGHHIG